MTIGGLTVVTSFDHHAPALQGAHRDFCSQTDARPDLRLRVMPLERVNLLYAGHSRELIFDAGGLWRLSRLVDSRHECLEVFNLARDRETPAMQAVYDPQDGIGVLGIGDNNEGVGQTAHPLYYPLDELLWIQLLARREALLLHACAAVVDGRALCFSGTSGAGKSTMARLIHQNFPQAKILSDERVIIRREHGDLYVYGTPWHGEDRRWLAERAPLQGIFLLEHAPEQRAQRLLPTPAASALLVRSFPPLYKAQGVEATLDLLAGLVEQVPVFRLQWRPDKTVFDCVREALQSASAGKSLERAVHA